MSPTLSCYPSIVCLPDLTRTAQMQTLHNRPLDTQRLDPNQARRWVGTHLTRYNPAFDPSNMMLHTYFTHTFARSSTRSMDGPQLGSVGGLRVRSYQAEMLERSLEGNVIVAVLLFHSFSR